MQLVVILSIGLLGLAQAKHVDKILLNDEDAVSEVSMPSFNNFIKTFNKVYKDENEYYKRFQTFKTNMKKAQELEKDEEGTAKYGATIFADLTDEEFKIRLGLKVGLKSKSHIKYSKAEIPDVQLPKNYDWRHFNVVTSVKDQGSCGSCWAFSTTGNIEGQYALKYNELISVSEQELVDCDSLDSGCDGGYPFLAYQAIQDIGGLELESDYNYTGETGNCSFKKSKAALNIVEAVEISTNETNMAQWLVKNGPISIGVNSKGLQSYKKGILKPKSCNPYAQDHAVLIVGYGIQRVKNHKKWKKVPYWIVKNSWGTSWGESGYYRIYRGKGICGLNLNPVSAVIA